MPITLQNFNQDAYPATDEFQCLQIIIPAGDEYKWLLAGLIRIAGLESSYMDPESAQAQGVAQLWQDAFLETDWSQCMQPAEAWQNSEVNCWVHEAQVIAGNALLISADTTQFHNLIGLQNTPTVNSKLRWTRYMAAGVWNFAYLYGRRSNGGIIDIYVTPPAGSTVVALNDHDTRGTTLANQFARGSFTIATSGEQTIEIEVVATSSGSNYGNTFTLLQMWRTGD